MRKPFKCELSSYTRKLMSQYFVGKAILKEGEKWEDLSENEVKKRVDYYMEHEFGRK